MQFLIVTHVAHKKVGNDWFAYGPYVREMNLWFKYVGEVTVIAPVVNQPLTAIDIAYKHPNIHFIPTRPMAFNHFATALVSLFYLPYLFFKTLKAMHEAQHIHLRCPGNMGLVGCIAQMFYPSKIKTAKYAGNWDKKSAQPFSYRLQQKILNNTFLTRNMTALIYGNWPAHSRNIKPFFTASYQESDKKKIAPREFNGKIKLIFVGALTAGKQPLLSAKVCSLLKNKEIPIELHIYGEGPERAKLENFITQDNLAQHIFLHGNQSASVLQQAFQDSHFLVFISKSEGWPKAVAEAMWWGCLPITSAVSCVPEMLGYGERGELVTDSEASICKAIELNLADFETYQGKCRQAMQWARKYTLEHFEDEIKSLVTA